MNIRVAIPSTGRPESVKNKHFVEAAKSFEVVYYVNHDDNYDAENVRIMPHVENGLVQARNQIILDAVKDNKFLIMSDDDLVSIRWITGVEGVTKYTQEYSFTDTILEFYRLMQDCPFNMGGTTIHANPQYFRIKHPIKTTVNIAALYAIKPVNNPILFDKQLRTKEDLDYCIQHILRYGGAYRVEYILPTYRQRTNKGGCQKFRSSKLERAMNDLMFKKYKGTDYLRVIKGDDTQLGIKYNWN